MNKRGLGRGLDSLLPTVEAGDACMQQVPVDQISPNPNQPRSPIDSESVGELAASVREVGLLQPVVVRPKELGFELIAGERRWRAAREAGLEVIPAVVRSPSEEESLELALIENLQRRNLNAVEEARAYEKLVQVFGFTQAEVAKRVGKSRVAVTNTMRLLNLPEGLQELLRKGDISSGHARALLSFENANEQQKMAERILREGLSVRQAESLSRLWQMAPGRRGVKSSNPATRRLARRLSDVLGARVRVKVGPSRSKVEIDFSSTEELRRICAALGEQVTQEDLPELPA